MLCKHLKTEYDLDLVSGKFFDLPIPQEKRWLLRYFRTKIEKQFLRYYFVFGMVNCRFSNHTGIRCTPRWIKMLNVKLAKLQKMRDEAKKNMDISRLAKIESGKIKLYSRHGYE